MAQFSRIDVAVAAKETGIVPVFYHKDVEVAKQVVKACYDGGARLFEFTNRGDFAQEVFAELVKYAVDELPGMIMGIGSVEEAVTAGMYIQMGTNFVVSPVMNPDMAKVCNRRKISWMPGCGSLSEISHAEELGAEVVKIFPASQVGGPDFIKAATAPKPFTNIMPTGGVKPEEDNLKEWFQAGAFCVGMGSQLMAKKEHGEFDLAKIEELMRESIAIAKKYKK
ncbi:MAG: bifunctional 4-hydroxy-2-oxoglutarate aldolase/2-dehydro-3-deoxy-phosphogluconate aldolase [Bacteroidota bacterium]